jgi:tetratricopeptide (TPR) repeat protein
MLVDDSLLVREGSGWAATTDLTEVPVPPTISGVLVARLDRLPHAERAAIERAAVEGKVFHRSSVEALWVDDSKAEVADALGGLLRKELIRPDRPVFADEEGYRFRHLLIRDAAYDSLPKQLRGKLHERHASWLQERIGIQAVKYDEIVGYHLEQAYGYRAELGQVDAETHAIGRRAAERLGAAGRRAFLRSDGPAGAKLLARAAAMLRPEDPLRVDLVPNVRVVQGLADLSWADRVLTDAIEASATSGDRALAAHALVQRGLLRLFSDPDVTPGELIGVSERAIAVFEELGDELGLARAWRLAGQAHYLNRQAAGCANASEQALLHARRSTDRFEEQEIIEWLVIALMLGPEPAPTALERCEQLLGEIDQTTLLAAEVLSVIAPLLAMLGRSADAEAAFERAKAIMTEQDEWIWIALFWHSFLHVWHGTERMGEPELRTAYETLKAIGEKSHFSSLAHALANVVLVQGRYDEAEILVAECEAASRSNDVHSQITSRTIRARIAAQRGAHDDAERLARAAIAFGADSDFLLARAEAHEGFAEILEVAGRHTEALEQLRAAADLYEQKGVLIPANALRARLAAASV